MTNSDPARNVSPERPAYAAPEKQPASIHDTLFYKTFRDPKLAAAELKHILPKKIADEIDWDALERDTNRFVDESLGNHYTDILLHTKMRGGKLCLRLLFEHSSHAKPLELLQTLRYQVRRRELEAQEAAKQRDGKIQRLSPILTIVLHHSETGWRGRMRFIDYFGLDEDLAPLLRPYVVDFGIFLDDISKVNTEVLLQRPVPQEIHVVLFALRHGRTGRRMLTELPKIAPMLAELWKDVLARMTIPGALDACPIRRDRHGGPNVPSQWHSWPMRLQCFGQQ